jgi:hypothetical protein
MNRFANSWAIAKQSWAVLQNNPSLAVFPLISGIGTLLVSIPFLAPFVLLAMNQEKHSAVVGPLGYVIGLLMYAAVYTVVIFCNSALVTCAYQNLRGLPSTPQEGFQNAMRHLPKIVGWAVLSATVGQVLRAVQEKGGILGAVVGGLVGLAWNLVVFFVVPLMVIENLGPIDALRESAERLKRTWGEQLILNGGMGLVSFVFCVLPLMALIALAVVCFVSNIIALGLILLGVGILYLMASMVVMSCLTTVYQTALYVWSSTGALPAGFSQDSIQFAFVQKQGLFR